MSQYPQCQFFPAKGLMGKPHQENGVYLGNTEIIFFNVFPTQTGEVKLPLSQISGIKHMAAMSINPFQVRVWNNVAFTGLDNGVLGVIPVLKILPEQLPIMIQSIVGKRSEIKLDDVLQSVLTESSMKPLQKNYLKVVWNSLKIWVYALLALLALVVVIAIFNS